MTGPVARPGAALRHVGHGRLHLDLLWAGGARCPTLALDARRWCWRQPHRRRYLTWSGPLAGGRGIVRQRWRGPVCCHRRAGGWRLRVDRVELNLRGDGVVIPVAPAHWRAWLSKTLG